MIAAIACCWVSAVLVLVWPLPDRVPSERWLIVVRRSALLMLVAGLAGTAAALLLALAYGVGPRIRTAWQCRRERLRFEAMLPDLCDALAAAMQAGLAFPAAIDRAADTFANPVRDVLRRAVEAMRAGMPPLQALYRAGAPAGVPEWQLFLQTLEALLHSGADPAPMLRQIADTVRRRRRVELRLRTLTAQGRLQAAIMAALPPLMLLMLGAVDPVGQHLLLASPAGWGILLVVVLLETGALLLAQRILRVVA